MTKLQLLLIALVLPTTAVAIPPGMSCVGGGNEPVFYIDTYEATTDADGIAQSMAGVLPTVNVTMYEARDACFLAGKRLCDQTEWRRACGGVNDFNYPYGDTLQNGYCNDSTGAVAPTGAFPACATDESVMDMVGNVNEWIDDVDGTWLGGWYSEAYIDGIGCHYRTVAFSTMHRDSRTGFRCCSDNEGESECPTAVLKVQIDIKPGSDPNCFNVNGHGVIPVAVMGSNSFDVSNIDQSTLSFAGLEVRVRGNKGPLCSLEDVDMDGLLDLVCHFSDDTTNWAPGESSTAVVSGNLIDGSAFNGSDTICVVP